ncbi:protein ECT2-like [Sycon ciliatum]|uniref:protein ECT2-like n=1 Tax=Sycon ciliatum TaxID=27933 RepID=UPI0031F66F0A
MDDDAAEKMDGAVSALPSDMTNSGSDMSLTANCGTSASKDPDLLGDSWMCVIGEDLKNNDEVKRSGQALGLSIAYTNEPAIPDCVPSGCNLAFICGEFDGPLFDKLWARVRALKSSRVRILGPPCLHYCAAAKVELPLTRRPIYSLSMSGVSVCFMGFKASEKNTMDSLVNMVRHMGADVRTDVSEVTHVVALGVTSSRYERAVALGKSIMSTDWVTASWQDRDKINARATDDDLMQNRLPPFTDLTLSFYGFDDEDQAQMEDFCQQYGGKAVPFGECCTHVVCSSDVQAAPEGIPATSKAVKMEWFWESIQIRACSNVNLHRFGLTSLTSPAPGKSPMHHRRRTVEPSVSITITPSAPSSQSKSHSLAAKQFKLTDNSAAATPEDAKLQKKLNERRNKCLELQDTEENYVSILNYIVQDFVKPLEMPNQLGGAILNPEEVKEIFYPLPQLAALHDKILTGLKDRFSPKSYQDSTCFGDVLLTQVKEMIKIYPRFINFYESRQECVLQKCKSNPRFTAFIQLRYAEASKQGMPYSKQKLRELLITPVQRMPRYLLLLQGIIKLTPDTHEDKSLLVEALEGFTQAAQRINEDKRIAEKRMAILHLQNVIENLPPTVLTSSRTISGVVNNLVLMEVGEGENMEIPASLVIFNDSLELTKRRGGREAISMEELTGNNGSNTLRSSSKKPLRHIDFLALTEMKRLLHFENAEDSTKTNILGIGVTSSTPSQEQWIILKVMPGSNQSPLSALESVTETLLKARADCSGSNSSNFLQVVSTELLPFSYDVNMTDSFSTPNKSLTKAIKGARHKARKVTRVFSHQVHRLEGLTPRRTGLRRSYAPPSNLPSRRHMVVDSVSFVTDSPQLAPSASMTSINSPGITKSRLSVAYSLPEEAEESCDQPCISSRATAEDKHDKSDCHSCCSGVSISPAKRKNHAETCDEDDDPLQPGQSGSLSKRKKENGGSMSTSSSVEEFQNLPLTFI